MPDAADATTLICAAAAYCYATPLPPLMFFAMLRRACRYADGAFLHASFTHKAWRYYAMRRHIMPLPLLCC